MELSNMSTTELRELRDAVVQKIREMERGEMLRAREQIMEIARNAGIDIRSDFLFKTKGGGPKATRKRKQKDAPAA